MMSALRAYLVTGLSAVFTLTILVVGAVSLRLAAGPVSLDSHRVEAEREIAAALGAAAPGWSARLGALQLRWAGRQEGLALRLLDLALLDSRGEAAFVAPEILLGLDNAALLNGALAVTSVSLVGSEAVISRDQDGRLSFAVAAAEGSAAEGSAAAGPAASAPAGPAPAGFGDRFDEAAAVVEAWSAAERSEGALASIRTISIQDAQITYEDALSGAVWRAPNARFELSRPVGGGLQIALEAALLASAEAAPAKISVTGRRAVGADAAQLTARFERAPFGVIAAQFPDLDALRAIEGFVSGEASAEISLGSGDLLALSATLRGEGAEFAALKRGAATTGDPARAHALALSAFSASFDYAPQSDALTLSRLEVVGDRLTAELEGRARFLRDPAGAAVGAEGALTLRSASILDRQLFSEPLKITGGGFDFTLEGGAPGSIEPPRLTLTRLTLETPDVSATGAADVLFAPPQGRAAAASLGAALGARADVDLALSDFDAARLAALWPLTAAPGGRDWVDENIIAGRIHQGRLRARIGGGAGGRLGLDAGASPEAGDDAARAEVIDFDFRFEGLESRYLGTMPPVEQADGAAKVSVDRFDLRMERGLVDLGEHGQLRLDGSTFAIPTFDPDIPPSEIEIRSRGSLRALLALLDEEPLALSRKLKLRPETATGTVAGVTRLALPLAKDLPIEAIAISAEGELANASLPVEPLGGLRASSKSAALEVDADQLRLKGDARIEGHEAIPIWVDWRETFAPGRGEARSKLVLAATLSAEQMREYGMRQGIGLTGSARLNAWIEAADDAPLSLEAKAILTKLGVVDPLLGWRKPEGAPGAIELSGVFENDGWSFSRLSASAEGLNAAGSARLAADGALETLTLGRLEVGTGTDLSLSVNRAADGALSISGGGPKLDLSGLFGPPAPSPPPAQLDRAAPEPRLSLDLNFDQVAFGEGRALQAVTLAAARSEQGGLYADLTAAAGRARVTAALRPGDGRQKIEAQTDDLGALLSALQLVNRAERGSATLTAEGPLDGRITGVLKASGLVVTDAPALADLLSVASVVGIFDLASSGGITFTKIEAPFVFDEERLVIDDMVAAGPSLGMTAKGVFMRKAQTLELEGSVSPAFVLNGLPSQVPVLGDLLTGGKGQGVLGVAYRVSGPIDKPKVTVNPLSALTPGPLRRLFGG